MTPSAPRFDARYCRLVNVVSLGQNALNLSRGAYFLNLRPGQLMHAVTLPSVIRRSITALRNHIAHVVSARPEKQVRRPHATTVVTAVTDVEPIGNLAFR